MARSFSRLHDVQCSCKMYVINVAVAESTLLGVRTFDQVLVSFDRKLRYRISESQIKLFFSLFLKFLGKLEELCSPSHKTLLIERFSDNGPSTATVRKCPSLGEAYEILWNVWILQTPLVIFIPLSSFTSKATYILTASFVVLLLIRDANVFLALFDKFAP